MTPERTQGIMAKAGGQNTQGGEDQRTRAVLEAIRVLQAAGLKVQIGTIWSEGRSWPCLMLVNAPLTPSPSPRGRGEKEGES